MIWWKLIPREIWIALVVLILATALYAKIVSDAEQRGGSNVIKDIQKEETDARDRAEAERRRLDRGDDSGVRRFDRK